MTRTLLCLNSEWQGCENPVLESGSRQLAAELFGVREFLDFGPSDSGEQRFSNGVFAMDSIAARFATVLETLRRESPGRVFTVGGSCGTEAAPIAYLNEESFGRLGVVWFDAHGDLNTPQSSPSGHFHGMVLRTLLGEGPMQLLRNVCRPIDPSRLVLAGVRDLDEAELLHVDSAAIRVLEGWPESATGVLVDFLSKAEVESVYIHIDSDVFETRSFDGALFSVPGGPTLRQVAEAVAAIAGKFDVVGTGIVEYCGRKDGSASRMCEFVTAAGLWPPKG